MDRLYPPPTVNRARSNHQTDKPMHSASILEIQVDRSIAQYWMTSSLKFIVNVIDIDALEDKVFFDLTVLCLHGGENVNLNRRFRPHDHLTRPRRVFTVHALHLSASIKLLNRRLLQSSRGSVAAFHIKIADPEMLLISRVWWRLLSALSLCFTAFAAVWNPSLLSPFGIKKWFLHSIPRTFIKSRSLLLRGFRVDVKTLTSEICWWISFLSSDTECR